MTLTEYYEYNVRNKVKRRREEYNYREYKPGYDVKMRHDIFAAQIRLLYVRLDWRLWRSQGRHGDTSTMSSRPLTIAEWDANLERLSIGGAENAREMPGSIRHMNGDLEIYNDSEWRIIE